MLCQKKFLTAILEPLSNSAFFDKNGTTEDFKLSETLTLPLNPYLEYKDLRISP